MKGDAGMLINVNLTYVAVQNVLLNPQAGFFNAEVGSYVSCQRLPLPPLPSILLPPSLPTSSQEARTGSSPGNDRLDEFFG